jgi:hypothetical protein
MKKKNVEQIKVPQYDELSVVQLWPQLQEDKQFAQYFPNAFHKDKGPARDYFFDILNTLYPDYLEQILCHACKLRHSVMDDEQRLDAIKISDDWLEELQSMPFTSCKCPQLLILTILSPQARTARRSSC